MHFYRLLAVAFLLFITNVSFALSETAQAANLPSENQPPWLMQEVIDLNKQINVLESNLVTILTHNTENTHNAQRLKQSLDLLKIEQVKLQDRIEFINVKNSIQHKGQNARVDDLGFYINMWGLTFAVAVVFLGFTASGIARKVAKKEAKKEAGLVSDSEFRNWITNNEEKIINDVVKRTEEKLPEINKLLSIIEGYREEVLAEIKEIKETALIFGKAKHNFAAMSLALENKSENEYTAEDWYNRSVIAYDEKDFQQSIIFLDFVITNSDNPNELIARALFAKSIVLTSLDSTESAIRVYSELIERFSSNIDPKLQKLVANGLSKQAEGFSKLGEIHKAIEVYEKLIEFVCSNTKLNLQKLLMQSLNQKAGLQSKQCLFRESIATYDELIKCFINDEKLYSNRLVNNAAFNVAEISLICEEKSEVLKRVRFADKVEGRTAQSRVVMQFIRFLVDDISIDEMAKKIEQLPENMKFTWNFDSIRSYLNEKTGAKKAQALAIAGYIENGEHDFEKLKSQLGSGK